MFSLDNRKQTHYKFSQSYNWFDKSELKRKAFRFLNGRRVNHILEIGSFEGRSSVFLAESFLKNELSFLYCVDPFLSISDNDHHQLLTSEHEANFLYNIEVTTRSSQVKHYKMTSDKFYNQNDHKFNFIYIDGCHDPLQIVVDLNNAVDICCIKGIIWMDDYLGGNGDLMIKKAIDSYLADNDTGLQIVHKGYQLGLKKYKQTNSEMRNV